MKELDKVYQSGLPEDDMRERAEEMERMREHVFREADTNHDNLISFDEFLAQTKREEFNRDPGWETVDNTPQFTHDEYLEFERRRQEEIQRLIAQGVVSSMPLIMKKENRVFSSIFSFLFFFFVTVASSSKHATRLLSKSRWIPRASK